MSLPILPLSHLIVTHLYNSNIAISRLQQISRIVQDVSIKSKEMSGHYEATLEVFSADFDKLSLEYSTEFEQLELDEVVVGAIAPFVSPAFLGVRS